MIVSMLVFFLTLVFVTIVTCDMMSRIEFWVFLNKVLNWLNINY